MNSIIERSKRDGSLVLYHDYRAGHIQDLSGRGNNGTGLGVGTAFTGTCGLQWQPTAVSGVTVADSTSLRLGEATFVVFPFKEFKVQSPIYTSERVFCKVDAGGSNYDVMISSTDVQINTRTRVASVLGQRMLSINAKNGEIPDLYINGILHGVFSGVLTMVADDAPLFIGNYYSGITRPFLSIMAAALIFNRKLTATEHSELFGELVSGNT